LPTTHKEKGWFIYRNQPWWDEVRRWAPTERTRPASPAGHDGDRERPGANRYSVCQHTGAASWPPHRL